MEEKKGKRKERKGNGRKCGGNGEEGKEIKGKENEMYIY